MENLKQRLQTEAEILATIDRQRHMTGFAELGWAAEKTLIDAHLTELAEETRAKTLQSELYAEYEAGTLTLEECRVIARRILQGGRA